MKIQCNVCEVAEAKVLCCADEAALCYACDEKVHAANKLASKHQRVSLSSSASQMPKCDICQETVGYFFCLEDRALLCRKCDVSIHTANIHVSAHRRFLLTGVKVALEPTEPGASSLVSGKSHVGEKITEVEPHILSKKTAPTSLASQYNNVVPVQGDGTGNFASAKMPFTGGSATGSMRQWHFDELLGLNEFNQNYGYMDNGSSKADSGKIEDLDCSSVLQGIDEGRDGDDFLGKVPDASWAVPQIPSPPTASGLYWPRTNQHMYDAEVFVPDTCSPMQYNCQSNGSSIKRRRQF